MCVKLITVKMLLHSENLFTSKNEYSLPFTQPQNLKVKFIDFFFYIHIYIYHRSWRMKLVESLSIGFKERIVYHNKKGFTDFDS